MRPLYKINEAIVNLFDSFRELIDENGEIDPEDLITYNKAIDELKMDRKAKLINTALYIKSLEAEKKSSKDVINYQKMRIQRLDREIKANSDRIASELSKDEIIWDTECRIKWKKSIRTKVDPDLIAMLPEKYQRIIHRIEAELNIIKADIKQGIDIPGASNVDHWELKIE